MKAREIDATRKYISHSKTEVSFTLYYPDFFCGVLQCTCTGLLGCHCRLSQPATEGQQWYSRIPTLHPVQNQDWEQD